MRSSACFALIAAAATPALAQYSTGFETVDMIAAAPTGMDLNGQDMYYNPDPATSISAMAYTYAGNSLAIAANPTGDAQFAAGTGPAGNIFARSQRDLPYGDGTGSWSICYDVACLFTGAALPTAQNVGSVSTQVYTPGSEATFISLARWVDPATAAAWNADYVWFNDVGTALTEIVPDPGFQNLMTNHWYRRCTTFDLDTNQITEVSITDLTNNVTVTYNPPDRYLDGGAAGGLPPPTGYRIFAGSATVAGNTMAVDNVDIQEAEGPCQADCNMDGNLNILDFVCFQGEWQNQTPAGDCNMDGLFNILDFVCYQVLFQKGCD